MHYAHLPEAEERVALALAADGDGPWPRGHACHGDFVTALSPEMRPKNLAIILSRAQVDAFSNRVLEARARFELAKDVVPAGQAARGRAAPPADARAWSPQPRGALGDGGLGPEFLGAQFLRDVYESSA